MLQKLHKVETALETERARVDELRNWAVQAVLAAEDTAAVAASASTATPEALSTAPSSTAPVMPLPPPPNCVLGALVRMRAARSGSGLQAESSGQHLAGVTEKALSGMRARAAAEARARQAVPPTDSVFTVRVCVCTCFLCANMT